MAISIHKLTLQDAQELLAFEAANRTYFEQSVPSRGDDYYDPGFFSKRHQDLLEEQDEGISTFYLIRDENHEIVGRINLVDMDPAKNEGFLGYRVGEATIGQGIATKALELLLENLEVSIVHAKTTVDNIGSQRVLEKSGFQKSATQPEEGFVHYIFENDL